MRILKKVLLFIAKPLGILSLYHFLLAWAGDIVYRHPSKEMVIIGVTGTKGKTTVIEIINAILEAAHKKVVLSSSNRFQVGNKTWINDTGNTMPGRMFIQKLLRQGVGAGCEYGLIEVVSEGIVQYRNRFIDFDVAVFIGLHPEHIEAHGSLEKYRDAKLAFFRDVVKFSSKKEKYFIINKNNPHSKYFIDVAGDEGAVLYEKYLGELRLAGDFNRENAAAAAAVTRALGIPDVTIRTAIASFPGVPGRMEFVQKEPFAVIVDYAHTPDSLEAVYETLKKDNKLICVFGSAGGGRDKWKRPKLGEVASKYCDEIILTNEDPFDENPDKILDEIKSKISIGEGKLHEILDRRRAIEKAIGLAGTGDVVVITGKGSEPYIRITGGKRVPWSDVKAVHGALAS